MFDYCIMSAIHEAPIIHGTISVSSLHTNTIEVGSTSFNAIDQSINSNSLNPVSNTVTKAVLDLTSPPVVSAFNKKMIKTNHLTSIGQILFDYVSQHVDTFGSSGPDGLVIAPTSGTYLITSNSIAVTQSNYLSFDLKVNDTEIKSCTGYGTINMSAQVFINNGDSITLHSKNTTQSETSFEITLIKANQTI